MNSALIVYWSKTGNTKKTADAISEGLKEAKWSVTQKTVDESQSEDYFNYDLVCIGAPSYQWLPAEPMIQFLKKKFSEQKQQGKIKPSAPKIHGKNALVFITYSGPHTGLGEAEPAGKYIGQYFEHIGFSVVAEWYILSEFHGSLENSTLGRLGDIRGKPTSDELQKIKEETKKLVAKLS
jgi:flavodoxin